MCVFILSLTIFYFRVRLCVCIAAWCKYFIISVRFNGDCDSVVKKKCLQYTRRARGVLVCF